MFMLEFGTVNWSESVPNLAQHVICCQQQLSLISNYRITIHNENRLKLLIHIECSIFIESSGILCVKFTEFPARMQSCSVNMINQNARNFTKHCRCLVVVVTATEASSALCSKTMMLKALKLTIGPYKKLHIFACVLWKDRLHDTQIQHCS